MMNKSNRVSGRDKPTIIVPERQKRGPAPEIADDADMKSFRRKWAILNMILDTEDGYTIDELAEHFDVSPRTIRRDIGIFDMVFGGFDAQVEKWGRKRFTMERIPLGNKLGDETSGLTRDELMSFCIAQRLMSPLKGTSIDENMKSGCDKMRSCLRKSTLEQVDRLASFFYRPEFKRPYNAHAGRKISIILEALIDSRGLKFRYNEGENDEDRIYTVLPCAILYNEGFIYLVGYQYKDILNSDDESVKPRHWKLSRILAMKLTNIRFRPPEEFNAEDYSYGDLSPYLGDAPAVRVKVQFDPSVATFVKEQKLPWVKNPTQKRNGSLEGEMDVNPDGFVPWILSFGSSAEVIAPRSMRDRLSYELRAIRNKYAVD